jgi:hypothetical protein
MQKEDLIYLHTVLARVKRLLEADGIKADFSEYEAMHISPVHIHRNKTDHQKAIFALGEAIVEAIGRHEVPKRITGPGIKEKGLAGLKA